MPSVRWPAALGLRVAAHAQQEQRGGPVSGVDGTSLAPARQPSLVGVVRSRARPAGRPDASPTCPCLSTANVPRGRAARARAGANARGGTAGGSDRDRRWPRVPSRDSGLENEMPPARPRDGPARPTMARRAARTGEKILIT